MKIKLVYLCSLLLYSSLLTQAQSLDSIAEKKLFKIYHASPVWINMMEDSKVNYFEACTAFEMYWVGREIPAETEGEANKLYEMKDKKKSDREKEGEQVKGLHFNDPASYAMIYEYKRFINWRRVMRNKIDPQTGRILTSQEQDAIWKNQIEGVNTHID